MTLCAFFLLLFCITTVLLIFKNAQLKKLSETDTLTGLPNYRKLQQLLKNKNHYKSVILLDIDNFGEFNKTAIHKGDEVLIEFAGQIKTLLQQKAIVCRYRLGDEFAIITLPSTNEEELIQALQKHFHNYHFQHIEHNNNYRLRFCYGLVYLSGDTDHDLNIAELLLAEAKRNRSKSVR
jgi:diguanylate cyclase (GGDEF)-like protein